MPKTARWSSRTLAQPSLRAPREPEIADSHADRLERAHASLAGLSVGDAFGECLFEDQQGIDLRLLPPPRWITTDDTEMAIAIVDVLSRHGGIDEDRLATAFARRHARDPYRGYGPGAREILSEINAGRHWREVAGEAFGGSGSMGNGSAMRVPPLGAYFADDEVRLVVEAARSAVVTHANVGGQAGAIAVAAAAGWAARGGGSPAEVFDLVLDVTPQGPTRALVERAAGMPLETDPLTVSLDVGSGLNTICADTVPFCLWAFARHLGDYTEALWTTVSVFGDRDTNCAIVGGLAASLTGLEGIPREWLDAREPLRHDLDLE
jgi:ADP-ribosylglycohydrolase